MSDRWKEWEGRTVDGRYVLETYLGGSDGTAVFRTRIDRGTAEVGNSAGGVKNTDAAGADAAVIVAANTDAAVKLVELSAAGAESQLRRWQSALELSHPNLLRILKTGRSTVDGREVVYAVEELAEENLAQIVPERALTGEEVRGMLGPVVSALEFLHGRGLVHGRLRPSNIFAVGDQVKLSSDNLRRTGDIPAAATTYDAPEVLADGVSTASDVWSLGITLVEVLTQRVPAWDAARMEMAAPDLSKNLPEPFRAIVQRCFRVDPAQRIKLREIAERLEGREARTVERPASLAETSTTKPGRADAISATARKRANGPYWLVLAVAIAVIVFLVLRPRPSSQPAEVQSSTSPTQNASPQDSTPQNSTPQNSTPQSHAPESLAQESPALQSPGHQSSSQQSPAQPNSAQRVPAQQASPPPRTQDAPAERQTAQSPSKEAARGEQKSPASSDEIIERSMPQVARSAQRTIHGKLKVRVRVEADAAGNVTEAKLKDAGPSPYFARAALEAARRWKFAPAADRDSREWTLLFAFSRARIEMSASRAP